MNAFGNKLLYKLFLLFVFIILKAEQITPYKYTDADREKKLCKYNIPASCRYTCTRSLKQDSDIVFYLSKPHIKSFPIAVLCGGSTQEDDIISIIHFHRYFLQEFLDLGVAVLTVEQQGVDGNSVNSCEFMEHYTRSNRLYDHCAVIEHLKSNPPCGWNGKLIFLGVSEGGALVTRLTTKYSDITLATINWCGAGDFSWDVELWQFMQDFKTKAPWYFKILASLPKWMPFSIDMSWASSIDVFKKAMQETIKNPTSQLKLAGMTYKYHADTLTTYPPIEYENIKTPFLLVVGEQDCIVASADAFVQKARLANVPITYLKILGMDHYIRKNQKALDDSFEWLSQYF